MAEDGKSMAAMAPRYTDTTQQDRLPPRPCESNALCQYCSGINIVRINTQSPYYHQPSLNDLKISKASCAGCNAIWKRIQGISVDHGRIILNLSGQSKVSRDILHQYCVFFWWNVGKEGLLNIGLRRRDAGPDGSHGRNIIKANHDAHFNLFTDKGDPAVEQGICHRLRLPTTTDSEGSYKQARKWIRDCLEKHERSESTGLFQNYELIIPKRLLELKPQKAARRISLVQISAVPAPYAALSYCWGTGAAPWKTTKANLSSRASDGFTEADLPLTLRHACQITRKLGLSYLWIDCLCILQDDVEEWLSESAKMHGIYNQAYVTIAAISSSSSWDGIFNRQCQDHRSPLGSFVRIKSILPDGRPSTLYITDAVLNRQWTELILNGPLFRRAWSCQELLLSPRILYYAKTQLFWQCAHMICSQDNMMQLATGETWSLNGTKFGTASTWRGVLLKGGFRPTYEFRDHSSREGTPTMTQWSVEGLSKVWYHHIVGRDYSRRKITYGRDKLPAVSSLAQMIYNGRPNPYYAGLWGDCLLEGLCWVRDDPGGKAIEYRAPSWSWAAQDTPVNYDTMVVIDTVFDCKVVHASTTPLRNGDPFGVVTDGLLQLDAKVLSCEVRAEGRPTWFEKTSVLKLRFSDGTPGEPTLDSDDEVSGPATALFLKQDLSYYYFLLVRENKDGQVVRIGVGRVTIHFPKRMGLLLNEARRELTTIY